MGRVREVAGRLGGARVVTVGVRPGTAARRLYERLGYRAGVPELCGLRTESPVGGGHQFLDPFDILVHEL